MKAGLSVKKLRTLQSYTGCLRTRGFDFSKHSATETTQTRAGTFKAVGNCALLLDCRDDEAIISGPAGTGKSRACLEKLFALAMAYPLMRGLIIRKTRESLSESGLFTWERYVLGEENPICSGMQRRFRQIYTFPNGSVVVVGGMDKATKIMSTEFDFIYVQEAIELTEDDWESLTTRLRNGVTPFQQLIGDTNPDRPTHWLKQRTQRGQCRLIDSNHEDNPVLYNQIAQQWTKAGHAYISRLDQLTGARKARLRHGKWVQAAGAVYEDYNAQRHLIDRFDIPEFWVRYRVVDFGFVHPFVCQWWAEDDDGRLYLYREIFKTQKTVTEHAADIKRWTGKEVIESTICDHDAENRATLQSNGIPVKAAKKAVLLGIQTVQERLKIQADGKPRLFILRDSVVEPDQQLIDASRPWCTEHEIDGYVWKNDREEPVKKLDDGVDAMRYMVMEADDDHGLLESAENPFYS